jgi:PKD repeat protein
MQTSFIMRNFFNLLFIAAMLICLPLTGQCQTNLTTEAHEGSGSYWSQAIWATNAPGTYINTSPLVAPVAGNTYEEVFNGTPLSYGTINNTRLRNPTASGSSQTFPGDSLTIDTNCEIRFKDVTGLSSPYPADFPGVNGNPGLIFNGGLIDDGDNGIWNIQGSIKVAGNASTISVLAPGGNIGNPPALTAQARSLIVGGQLSGSGSLAVVLTPTNNPILVTNGLNTFYGNWFIQEGWLIGTTPQCLGSANITVDPQGTNLILAEYPALVMETSSTPNDGPNTNDAYAILDFDYAANCTGTLILTNGGLMNLHTNCTFGNLIIEGTALPDGVYSYNYLTNHFTNFLAGGSGQITIQVPVPPPAPAGVSAVPSSTSSVLISWLPAATATGYIISRSTASGGPYTPVGTTNSLAYTDSGLTEFQTYYYVVQATNVYVVNGTNVIGVSTNSIQVSATPSPSVAGVTNTVNPASVALSWNSYSGAISYTVQRSTISGGPYTPIASGITGTNYTDTSVANGTLYYYVVEAQLSIGLSAPSTEDSALTYPSLPSITTDLYGTSGIFLQLSTPDPQTPDYVLNVSSDGVNFSPLATLQGGTNNFLDTGLNEGTEYYFNVQATNSSGASAVTAVVSNSIPVGTISFAFGTAASGGNGPSPAPPGYIQDIGLAYGDQGNGTYGWATNTIATPYDMSNPGMGQYNGNVPPGDLRKQSFIHQTTTVGVANSEVTNFYGLPLSFYPFWAVADVPNGVYQVRVASGDQTANNSTYQQTVNGVTTPSFAPGAGNPFFVQWMVVCEVTNNTLIVAPANTNNDKINYVDIYPAVLPAASFTYGPASGQAPLTVNFTNSSTGAYTADFWSFDTNGDTLASTNQVVSFTYTSGGSFTVSLTVSNDFGNAATYTVTNAVTTTAPQPVVMSIGPVAGGMLQLSWTTGQGLLLQATNLNGPWITNVGASSPYTIAPTNKQTFYRIQLP